MPTVRLTPEVWSQICDLHTEFKGFEFTTLGLVDKDDPLLVTKLFFPKQENGRSDTLVDEQSLAELTCQVVKAGEDPALIKFWQHSHGSMNVFWSSEDTDNIKRFGGEGEYGKEGYLISLVTNDKMESKCRLDLFGPWREVKDNNKWEIEVEYPDTREWVQAVKDRATVDKTPRGAVSAGLWGHKTQKGNGGTSHHVNGYGGPLYGHNSHHGMLTQGEKDRIEILAKDSGFDSGDIEDEIFERTYTAGISVNDSLDLVEAEFGDGFSIIEGDSDEQDETEGHPSRKSVI